MKVNITRALEKIRGEVEEQVSTRAPLVGGYLSSSCLPSFLGEATLSTKVSSNPPQGKCRVVNFYVDPTSGKLVIEYDNIPV